MSAALLKKLQGVQNAAARFIAGVRRFDHITPVLHDLHWLPVQKRIVFKIATLVYKCMHEMAPSYLARDCVPASSVAGRSRLRSGSGYDLVWSGKATVSRTRTFGTSGPTVWNALPVELRAPELSIESFRKKLKTYLFTSPN